MPHDCDYQASEIETKVERFRSLVASHDLTYTYSDDGRCYSRGKAQREEIERLRDEIGLERATAIWNENVDRRISEPYRAGFYWGRA